MTPFMSMSRQIDKILKAVAVYSEAFDWTNVDNFMRCVRPPWRNAACVMPAIHRAARMAAPELSGVKIAVRGRHRSSNRWHPRRPHQRVVREHQHSMRLPPAAKWRASYSRAPSPLRRSSRSTRGSSAPPRTSLRPRCALRPLCRWLWVRARDRSVPPTSLSPDLKGGIFPGRALDLALSANEAAYHDRCAFTGWS
jgi:hypothetical protein